MEFEWDPDKAERNKRKHKIDFETAAKVFDDPFRLETDETDDQDVVRYKVTGMVDARLVVVIYTVRGEAYRIISARLADPHERRDYHEI
jgi:uncharacterized DUF497 family protein